LGDLFAPRDVERARAEAAEAESDAERAAAVERLLLAHRRGRAPDPLVAAALRRLDATHGAIRIGALARELATSQDPLEKRFRAAVGASPKQLASLLRVRHALASYRPGLSLGQLAQDAGYFDQAHFNREVRAVIGEAPGRFLRAGGDR
jgi:methylphosphotriester-DNA--protein-cysteine methyltransferase